MSSTILVDQFSIVTIVFLRANRGGTTPTHRTRVHEVVTQLADFTELSKAPPRHWNALRSGSYRALARFRSTTGWNMTGRRTRGLERATNWP
jgi:hypothetical protein